MAKQINSKINRPAVSKENTVSNSTITVEKRPIHNVSILTTYLAPGWRQARWRRIIRSQLLIQLVFLHTRGSEAGPCRRLEGLVPEAVPGEPVGTCRLR